MEQVSVPVLTFFVALGCSTSRAPVGPPSSDERASNAAVPPPGLSSGAADVSADATDTSAPVREGHVLGDRDPAGDPAFRSAKNRFAHQRGWRFRVSVPGVIATELGCRYPDSDVGSKTLVLFEEGTQRRLARVKTEPGPEWRWARLDPPIPLAHGGQYVVAAHSSGAQFAAEHPNRSWRARGAIEHVQARFCNACGPEAYPAGVIELPDAQYGLVDIGIEIDSSAPARSAEPRSLRTRPASGLAGEVKACERAVLRWRAAQPQGPQKLLVVPGFPGIIEQIIDLPPNATTFTLPMVGGQRQVRIETVIDGVWISSEPLRLDLTPCPPADQAGPR